jgi:hypothetical protein
MIMPLLSSPQLKETVGLEKEQDVVFICSSKKLPRNNGHYV